MDGDKQNIQVNEDNSNLTEVLRIDFKYVLNEIASVLSFKKGILYTIKVLLISPGKNIEIFIKEDRQRLVKPVIYVVFCSFVFTILQRWLGFEDGYEQSQEIYGESSVMLVWGWVQRNYSYSNMIGSIFTGLWIKLMFRKHGYNFFEILVVLLFAMGTVMLLYTFLGIVEILVGHQMFMWSGIVAILYMAWVIGQFFGRGKVMSYIKGLLSNILGSLTFTFIVIVIGLLLDVMNK